MTERKKPAGSTSKKMLAAAMVAAGEYPDEVAKKLGVSRKKVNSDVVSVVRQFGLLGPATIDDARKILGHVSGRAAERLGGLIDSEDEHVALKAAGSVLDRVGLGAKSQMQLDVRRVDDATLEAEALEAARMLLESQTDG